MAVEEASRAHEVVKLLAGSSSEPRLAMRGVSMTPLLREPMVLRLGPCGSDRRVGDVLVFERDGQLVAHRLTSMRGGLIQTCGDAFPWSPEYPELRSIVGKVIAVMASDSPDAPRVDTPIFRLRGVYKARCRWLRSIPFRLTTSARRAANIMPWARKRPFVALVQAMSAAVRDDKRAFELAIASVHPAAIAAVARRHGCSATLVETASRMKSEVPAALYLRRSLREVGRSVVLRGIAIKMQINQVVTTLARAGIRFALLKGAARLYRDEPGATLHASSDLDILVPASDLDAAAAALREQGYHERADAQRQTRYRERHHHAAPLHPPGPGCAIELHVALAPPGNLSIPLDWEALESSLAQADGPAGPVLCLDDVGAALHYAVHAIGLHRLRDSLLLAQLLRRLSKSDLERLRRIVMSEQADPIRLDSAVALAARMAGVGWPASGPVEEYLRWYLRREDVPLYFAHRSQLAEGWFAGDRRITPLMWRLLDPRPGLGIEPGSIPVPMAVAGRVFASACAYLYARCMRPVA
jgi:hypothetical protein